MESILNKPIVLKLNAAWQKLGWTTPKKAFVDMCGGAYGGTPPAMALDITLDENGDLETAVAVKWEDWVNLPVRECDLAISMRSGAIRCPLVIVAPNYTGMPLVVPGLSKEAILERDGYRDQYTGEVFAKEDLNLDHVIPKSKGGDNSWENLVACHKKRNFSKGNKLNHEVGLKLIRKPKAPKPIPRSFLIKEAKRPEHKPFINK